MRGWEKLFVVLYFKSLQDLKFEKHVTLSPTYIKLKELSFLFICFVFKTTMLLLLLLLLLLFLKDKSLCLVLTGRGHSDLMGQFSIPDNLAMFATFHPSI